jgi:hypothetical protein
VIEVARQLAILVLVIGAILLPMYATLRVTIIGVAVIAVLVALLLKVRLRA